MEETKSRHSLRDRDRIELESMAVCISLRIDRSHWESDARDDCGVKAEEELSVAESIEED